MKKVSQGNYAVRVFIHLPIILFCIFCVISLASVVSISLTNEDYIFKHGFSIFPGKIDLTGYRMIFESPGSILYAYRVSVGLSIIGPLLCLTFTSLIAYPISRSDFRYNNMISFIIYFTMLFSGGLVPWYIMVTKYLMLKDSFWALVLPLVFNPYYILLMRTFMKKIPVELIESAKIDGLSELRIYRQIILPLSKPGIATIGLFSTFAYWNDWFNAMLFINNPKLVPLQLLLYRLITNSGALITSMTNLPAGFDISHFPANMTKMSMCVVAAGPMLVVFPFFQKYFVKGMTIGSIKG